VSPSDGENDRLLRLWAKGASKVMERALENLTPSLAPRKWWAGCASALPKQPARRI